MSSYYPSFEYLGINSRDKGLVVAHFDADVGEVDTYLGMEPVYTESSDGSRRLDYGAKYNNVAVFRITVIKQSGEDFSVKEVRENLKWLTGSKKNSQLNLFENFTEEFSGDGTTTSFNLINTCDHIAYVSVGGINFDKSKWTYNNSSNSVRLTAAPAKGATIRISYGRIKYSFVCRVTNAWQYKMDARTSGLILEFTSISPWAYSSKQTVSKAISGSTTITINNESDDLYGYTPVNITFKNTTGDSLIITNNSTGDISKVTNVSANETITMSNNMTIQSDKTNKVFGNSFNFVFQRLVAGENDISIQGTGTITFEYVYALKVGDCAMDISIISDPVCNDAGEIILDTLDWSRISNTPTTYQGYGIKNVYSKVEVDKFLTDLQLPFSHIIDLPNNFQAYNIKNVYSKTEVDNLLADIQIDETELNKMLGEELS